MKKVVLIEPNEKHQDIFAAILRKKSFFISAVKHSLVAKFGLVNCSLNDLPDMIIIGYGISENDTLEFVKFIRKKFYFTNMKILKICPNKTKESCLKVIEAGADDFICLTDFTPETFINKIMNLFNKINLLYPNLDSTLSFTAQNLESTQSNVVHSSTTHTPLIPKAKLVKSQTKKVNWNEVKRQISLHDLERKLKKAAGAKAIPFVVTELLSLTSSVDSDLKELIHFIELDPGITARVLRSANSAFYRGNKGRIYNLMDAVKTMGFNGLKDLVLAIGILDTFSKSTNTNGLNRMKLWYHSLTVGVIAKEIAKLIKHQNPDFFFVSGILHDLGCALFDEYFPMEYNQVLALAQENEVPLAIAEHKMMGMDHCEMAVNILKSWGFPDTILYAIKNHHKSFTELLSLPDKQKQDMIIIKLADCLTKIIGAGLFNYDEIEEIPEFIFSFLNLNVSALNEMLLSVIDHVNELILVMFLNIDPSVLSNCNSLSSHRLIRPKKVLVFNNQTETYSCYETIFHKLNYTVSSSKNIFALPESSDFSYMFLEFSEEKDTAQYTTILKKIVSKQKEKIKICVVTTEKIFNTITSNKELGGNIVYLLNPLTIEKIIEAIEKLDMEEDSSLAHTL